MMIFYNNIFEIIQQVKEARAFVSECFSSSTASRRVLLDF